MKTKNETRIEIENDNFVENWMTGMKSCEHVSNQCLRMSGKLNDALLMNLRQSVHIIIIIIIDAFDDVLPFFVCFFFQVIPGNKAQMLL